MAVYATYLKISTTTSKAPGLTFWDHLGAMAGEFGGRLAEAVDVEGNVNARWADVTLDTKPLATSSYKGTNFRQAISDLASWYGVTVTDIREDGALPPA